MSPTPTTRALGGLLDRLTAESRLRGTRAGGRPVPTADLVGIDVTGVTHDSRAVSPGMLFVAVPGLRRRPLGNTLLLVGFALAAAGSAVAGLGAAQTAAFVALAACLLYAGSVART